MDFLIYILLFLILNFNFKLFNHISHFFKRFILHWFVIIFLFFIFFNQKLSRRSINFNFFKKKDDGDDNENTSTIILNG